MTVAHQGMLLTATGIVLGLASVWGLTRFLKALLYGVSATDPANLALMTSVLFVAAGLAAFLPARRATQIAAGRVNSVWKESRLGFLLGKFAVNLGDTSLRMELGWRF